MTVERYHPALVVLHWLLGGLIVLGLLMGTFLLEDLPNSDPAKLDGLRGHMINGAVIGCLMVGLVFTMVASGIALAVNADLVSIVLSGCGKPLPATFDGWWMRVLHAIAAKLLMALIVLHVAAALWHHALRQDGLLRRMGWSRER